MAGQAGDAADVWHCTGEQEELRGFTKKQVYNKRDNMSRAGLDKVKVSKVKV